MHFFQGMRGHFDPLLLLTRPPGPGPEAARTKGKFGTWKVGPLLTFCPSLKPQKSGAKTKALSAMLYWMGDLFRAEFHKCRTIVRVKLKHLF